jgi:acetolactate synthase-1/3 small subunit
MSTVKNHRRGPGKRDADGTVHHHILSVLVENKAGLLARVSGLFARRGFNIFSLAVAPSVDDRFSRITIVVDVASASLEQITKQLFKLIHVVRITELHPDDSVERELMLVTIKVESTRRAEAIELAGLFDAQILEVGAAELTMSLADTPDRLDAFEALLKPLGITRLQRTGRIALPKLSTE